MYKELRHSDGLLPGGNQGGRVYFQQDITSEQKTITYQISISSILQGGIAGSATSAPDRIFASQSFTSNSGVITFKATGGHSTVPVDWFAFGKA